MRYVMVEQAVVIATMTTSTPPTVKTPMIMMMVMMVVVVMVACNAKVNLTQGRLLQECKNSCYPVEVCSPWVKATRTISAM